jgi:hypothetical protein
MIDNEGMMIPVWLTEEMINSAKTKMTSSQINPAKAGGIPSRERGVTWSNAKHLS